MHHTRSVNVFKNFASWRQGSCDLQTQSQAKTPFLVNATSRPAVAVMKCHLTSRCIENLLTSSGWSVSLHSTQACGPVVLSIGPPTAF